MNRTDDAEAILREVLQGDEDDFGARYRLGVLELGSDPGAAEPDLERAAELRPELPGPRFFLARARFRLDESGSWADDLALAVALARARAGFALAETTETVAAALEQFRAQRFYLAASPLYREAGAAETDPGLWFLAGWAELETGNGSLARTAAEHALELDPQFPEALVLQGRVRRAEGDLNGAQASYEQALALAPDLPLAHAWMGVLLLDRTEYREGLLELWHSILADPTDPAPHRELGHAYFTMRMPTEGVPYLERSDWLVTFLRRSSPDAGAPPR